MFSHSIYFKKGFIFRISIGWGPVSTVREHNSKIIKGFNVSVLLDKKNPKTFLLNKTEYKVDIQVIQVNKFKNNFTVIFSRFVVESGQKVIIFVKR
jgi:hypothetical protein